MPSYNWLFVNRLLPRQPSAAPSSSRAGTGSEPNWSTSAGGTGVPSCQSRLKTPADSAAGAGQSIQETGSLKHYSNAKTAALKPTPTSTRQRTSGARGLPSWPGQKTVRKNRLGVPPESLRGSKRRKRAWKITLPAPDGRCTRERDNPSAQGQAGSREFRNFLTRDDNLAGHRLPPPTSRRQSMFPIVYRFFRYTSDFALTGMVPFVLF